MGVGVGCRIRAVVVGVAMARVVGVGLVLKDSDRGQESHGGNKGQGRRGSRDCRAVVSAQRVGRRGSVDVAGRFDCGTEGEGEGWREGRGGRGGGRERGMRRETGSEGWVKAYDLYKRRK